MLGIDFDVVGILPADGTGGAGFDTNGETLFVPPVLLERYIEAAQQILDRVVVTPQIYKTFTPAEMQPAAEGAIASVSLPVYMESAYDIQVAYDGGDTPPKLRLKIDGADAGALAIQRRRIVAGKPLPGPTIAAPPDQSGTRHTCLIDLIRRTCRRSESPHYSAKAGTAFAREARVALPPVRYGTW